MLSKLMRDLKPPRVVVIPGLITEHGDAHARAFWTVALIVYLAANFKAAAGSAEFAAAAGILVVQIFFTAAAFFAVSRRIAEGPRRLICTILLDQAIFNVLLLHAGPLAAPFVLGPLVMIFGSGLRYGRVYGLVSWIVGTLLFIYAMYASPFWSQHDEIRAGLILAIALIPPYVFRLTDELALAIRIDSMTKLKNVVAFEETLHDLCLQLPKATVSAAVVMIDLDGFKTINDTQGHDGGDDVLKDVAYCLSDELSKVGVPARVGGDEFAVIVGTLPEPALLDTGRSQRPSATASAVRCHHGKNLQTSDYSGARRRHDHACRPMLYPVHC